MRDLVNDCVLCFFVCLSVDGVDLYLRKSISKIRFTAIRDAINRSKGAIMTPIAVV